MSQPAVAPASPPALVPVPSVDFPTWLPPMLVKELRQGLRTRGFVGAVVIFQLVMVLLMLGALISGRLTGGAIRAVAFNSVNTFFWVLLTMQLLIGTPFRGLAALRTEIDTRSIDLLMLTRLSAWRIVIGKWGSLFAQGLLLAVAMAPYGVVRYFGGSVNLTEDAVRCLGLLGLCAVFTAMAIWTSGLPRGFQVVLPVVLVASFQFIAVAGRIGGGPFPALSGTAIGLYWFNGAVLLGFFLVSAVRRIAPAAENLAAPTRIIALLPLLATPVFREVAGRTAGIQQFGFAAGFLAFVCWIELGGVVQAMPIHQETWARRSVLLRLPMRFLLPGWPSALLYALVAAMLVMGIVCWPNLTSSNTVAYTTRLAVLALGALTLPVAIGEFLPRLTSRMAGAFSVIVLGTSGIFAAIVANTASGTWLDGMARILPGSSFWMAIPDKAERTEIMVGQVGFVVVTVLIALAQSLVRWKALSGEVRRRRLAAAK